MHKGCENKKMALCQKFGRLLIGAEARFSACTDVTNFSTSLNQSPAPTQIPARLPSGYNAPKPFALFTKDQMMGKSGGVHFKILSTNWKSLSEDEKQNYSERAKKIGDELRDNFEKLTDGQKKDLWDKHVEIRNKRRKLQMKMKLQKIPARLPSGYNAPKPFALFTKDQMTGQSGRSSEMVKIVLTNWKSLGEKEKQNYSELAKRIGDELRDNFEKLTDGQKKHLWDKHAEKMNNRMKKKLHKFYAETNRPKGPLPSYLLFIKERFEKQTEPFKTRDKLKKFVVDMGKRWRQMTDAEKRPYVDQAQDNLAAYHKEMAEWKQKYANEIRAWKEVKAARKARDTQFTEALFEWNIDDYRDVDEKEPIHQMLLDDSTHLIETRSTLIQAFEWNNDDGEVDEKERIHQMLLDDSTHLVEKRERSSDDDKEEEEEAIQRMFLAISTYLGRKEISQKQRIEY